jgi:hypothetical protein
MCWRGIIHVLNDWSAGCHEEESREAPKMDEDNGCQHNSIPTGSSYS